MNKTDKYELRDALEHALFLLGKSLRTNEEYNWDEAPVICEINGYRWLLGIFFNDPMRWEEAKSKCESIGGEIPPREVLLLAYLNEDIRPFFKEGWYWANEEKEHYAWIQYYSNGIQTVNLKYHKGYTVAVKKVKL